MKPASSAHSGVGAVSVAALGQPLEINTRRGRERDLARFIAVIGRKESTQGAAQATRCARPGLKEVEASAGRTMKLMQQR
jgi:hypothetical protein